VLQSGLKGHAPSPSAIHNVTAETYTSGSAVPNEQKRRLTADVVGVHPAGRPLLARQVSELIQRRQASSCIAQFAAGASRAHRTHIVQAEGRTGLRVP
jgi:hypothetical protein